MTSQLDSSRPARAVLLLGALLLAASAPLQAQVLGSVGFDYSTGKYGAAQSTDILYIPYTVEFPANDSWTVKVTVPYLRVSGPGNVVSVVGGAVVPPRATTTESGLGDIVAAASCDYYRDEVSGLTLGLTGKVKFATASRSRGLGTGEHDFMFQFDASRKYGAVTPFGSVGYRILGDPPGFTLRNGFYGSAGAAIELDQATSVGGAIDLKERTRPSGDGSAELSAFLTHHLDSRWRVQGYLVAGLTNASPDFGFGGVVRYSF